MSVELLNCPFCGKAAKVAPDEIGSGGQHVLPYHAGCFRQDGCGFTFTDDDPAEAVRQWNTRAIPVAEIKDGILALTTIRDALSKPTENWHQPYRESMTASISKLEQFIGATTPPAAEGG